MPRSDCPVRFALADLFRQPGRALLHFGKREGVLVVEPIPQGNRSPLLFVGRANVLHRLMAVRPGEGFDQVDAVEDDEGPLVRGPPFEMVLVFHCDVELLGADVLFHGGAN